MITGFDGDNLNSTRLQEYQPNLCPLSARFRHGISEASMTAERQQPCASRRVFMPSYAEDGNRTDSPEFGRSAKPNAGRLPGAFRNAFNSSTALMR